ncbi:hypothetical protein K458DRAFT_479944 [Lentithecium fluviatile CBS 122367]|uniref:G domain-containing protein n=1 Tax=Lentithecium fluviatile CBS 122367 TaxID=1168545 RepID=A0A6G1IQG6_9PLEO|nr:hypothetical protein K458DRAFT_479944 [Lentithecium fluviatile CBS 122367]
MYSQQNGDRIPGSYPRTQDLSPPQTRSRRTILNPNRKIEDIYIAVMGVTGAGKSSFIELCTGQKLGIGEGLRSHTQEVGEFAFMFKPNLRVHLVDTPGFDDTDRKDTDVLRDVAGWLGVSYKNRIRLSGMIYLHRIIDVRMQGTAKRNLFMFQKLCGPECFGQIVLATTMWSLVPPDLGAQRERELIKTEDFWGYMYQNGSQIMRHKDQTDRSSALAILDTVIRNRREVTLRIQREMGDGLELEQTGAGRQLNADIIEEREKHRKEMADLQRDKEEALAMANQEAAEQIARLQSDLAKKIQDGEESQKRLRIDLEKLQAEREEEMAKLLAEIQEQHKKLKAQEEEYHRLKASNQTHATEWQDKMRQVEENMQKEKARFESQLAAMTQKKSGVMTEFGEWLQQKWDDVCDFFESL